ncbi:MAG: hypothetical protein HOK52_15350 [Candidatus Marinimicrobia bacterium]|jgi:hypothetical protein|nr:hypothetical protein [Candidatus Neomarinimicrobiota bacterium]
MIFVSKTTLISHIILHCKNNIKYDIAGYIESHKATSLHPHFRKVEDLYNDYGSEAKEMRTFRQKLKIALKQLAKQQIIKNWEIDINDTFIFVK